MIEHCVIFSHMNSFSDMFLPVIDGCTFQNLILPNTNYANESCASNEIHSLEFLFRYGFIATFKWYSLYLSASVYVLKYLLNEKDIYRRTLLTILLCIVLGAFHYSGIEKWGASIIFVFVIILIRELNKVENNNSFLYKFDLNKKKLSFIIAGISFFSLSIYRFKQNWYVQHGYLAQHKISKEILYKGSYDASVYERANYDIFRSNFDWQGKYVFSLNEYLINDSNLKDILIVVDIDLMTNVKNYLLLKKKQHLFYEDIDRFFHQKLEGILLPNIQNFLQGQKILIDDYALNRLDRLLTEYGLMIDRSYKNFIKSSVEFQSDQADSLIDFSELNKCQLFLYLNCLVPIK